MINNFNWGNLEKKDKIHHKIYNENNNDNNNNIKNNNILQDYPMISKKEN
jgi:hypothetical protein